MKATQRKEIIKLILQLDAYDLLDLICTMPELVRNPYVLSAIQHRNTVLAQDELGE